MEFLLLIWDEIDDWAHACRHVAGTAVSEVAQVVTPMATAMIAASVSFWGSFRGLLP